MTNTTSGRSIDPRFDPAFQPGYDPQSDPARAARVPSYDASVDSPRRQRGRVVEPPRARQEPYTVTPTETSRIPPTDAVLTAGAAIPADVNAPSLVEMGVSQRRNPFLIALWAFGLLLLGLGVYAGQQVLDPTTDLMVAALRGDSINYFSVQLFVYGSPLLVVLGLGTFVLALFLHALRWRARS